MSQKINPPSGRFIFLLLPQIFVKRCFLYTRQLGNFTNGVLTCLVELHGLANSIAVYRFATAFPDVV